MTEYNNTPSDKEIKTELWCPSCKTMKSVLEFHRSNGKPSGYQSRCIVCHKKLRDAHRITHREENNAKNRLYYANHRAEKRAYYEKHVAEKKLYDQNYAIENHEKVKSKDKAKRARKLGATVEKFTDKEIFERDLWICQICFKKVNRRLRYPNPLCASLDHIIPLSKGGSHSRQNCCLAHLRCNVSKQNRCVPQQTRLF